MQIGMVGLGRMGGNMAERLIAGGHDVTGFDQFPGARDAALQRGLRTVDSLQGLVQQLAPARVIWLMLPEGAPTDSTIDTLLPLLARGDTVIDGGNSNYQDTLRRAQKYATHGLGYVDCGTSGGIWGLQNGYSLMIGGEPDTVAALRPLFATLAPEKDKGWGHVGPVGSGHFAKMIHNGIEYGMMQAIAEGFAILSHKQEFAFDLAQIGSIWSTGSVVRSWLLDLTTDALTHNPTLSGIAPFVSDSGEGRWTVSEAIALNVSAPVITLSLLERLRSRDATSFSDKLLAAMRNEFGGHAVKKE